MNAPSKLPGFDKIMDSLADCLTPEVARRVLELKADPALQARIDELADRNTEGTITPAERAEYGNYVTYGTFIAILKSKIRLRLAGVINR